MAAPDLTFARRTVAGLMPDSCTITRNPGGVSDDALDPDTLQLIAQEVPSWYEGPCTIRLEPGTDLEGIGQISIPFDPDADPIEQQLQRGDVVECTASGNPALVGRRWAVGEPLPGSYSVTRKARLLEGRR